MNELLNVQVSVFIGDNEAVLDYDPIEEVFMIANRVYDKPKHFHYDWIWQYVDRESMTAMRDAIDSILSFTAEAKPNE